jgi:chromosome partitioning protein
MLVTCVVNKKGGVGKSTVTAIMAQLLALLGRRVLVIDNDEQHNVTNLLGLQIQPTNIRHLYTGERSLEQILSNGIIEANTEGVYCITADSQMSQLTLKKDTVLRDFLQLPIMIENFDHVLIDNSPSISPITDASIKAATHYIVPVMCKKLAYDGLGEMFATLKNLYHIPDERIHILPNAFRRTISAQKVILMSIRQIYGNCVTKAEIPLDETLDEIAIESDSKVLFLNRYSASSVAHFLSAAMEIFDINEDDLYLTLNEKRKQHKADVARKNFNRRKILQQASFERTGV